MSKIFRFISAIKTLIKKALTIKESIKVFYNYLFVSSKCFIKVPKVYYGGSMKGDIGGPLVKIKKLNIYFPEHQWKFNIVYLLSNSIYLNSRSINLLKKRKLPIVLNQNGVFYPEWFQDNWEKENKKMSLIYHSADYVLWQSNFCKKAAEKFLGKRDGGGEILYNAVDTSFFKPKNKSLETKFKFLITGNIRKKNNYRISSVIYAMKEIIKEDKNIELIIAGFIEDKKKFKLKIKELKLEDHIIFHGKYSQEDAPRIYQNADAYITITFQDNCPTAVLEAMACGLPILYSSSGGIPELVDKYSGLGIKVSESWHTKQVPRKTEIADGMRFIIENKINMSQASRNRSVELFDTKKWIIKHKDIFEKLLDQKIC